jgi:hypothetical protein
MSGSTARAVITHISHISHWMSPFKRKKTEGASGVQMTCTKPCSLCWRLKRESEKVQVVLIYRTASLKTENKDRHRNSGPTKIRMI